jgi:chemotaxis protein CheD
MSALGQPAISLPRETVMQGQVRVSGDSQVELTTVLGSCVAACFFDPSIGIGGMNHFLLSEPRGSATEGCVDEHYGVYLMECLINEMLARGATRSGMRAHLYGGANLHHGMGAIGTLNARFAITFVNRERIALVHTDLGGTAARRVDFQPARGRARCRTVTDTPPLRPLAPAARGDVEFF